MNEMNEFEQRLQKAMRRVDAPEGFAERVQARAESASQHSNSLREAERDGRKGQTQWTQHMRSWFGAAGFVTAALLLVGLVTGERVHERHERTAVATQEFETATRITDKALEHTREQLAKAGVSLE